MNAELKLEKSNLTCCGAKLCDNTLLFNNVLDELKKQSVCKNCIMVGHLSASPRCLIKIKKKEKDYERIKEYLWSQNLLDGINFEELTDKLDLSTLSYCMKLYRTIPKEELVNRPMDKSSLIEHFTSKELLYCTDCNESIYNIVTPRFKYKEWRGNYICDNCWCKYKKERDDLWELIHKHTSQNCKICETSRGPFHYDHISMFDKVDSICSMINKGDDIKDIYEEIDKCQLLCLQCHRIVTYIESRFGFTGAKSNLTKKLNNGKISQEEHLLETVKWNKIYKAKMFDIYSLVREVRMG